MSMYISIYICIYTYIYIYMYVYICIYMYSIYTVSNLPETMAWMLPEIDPNICGMHRLMIINQHTKFHKNRRRSCKFQRV